MFSGQRSSPCLRLFSLWTVAVFALAAGQTAPAQQKTDLLTSRPLPKAPAIAALEVGGVLDTSAGQRRQFRLPDGSLLFVNENTRARLESPGKLTLAQGEIFAALTRTAGDKAAFAVETPFRSVSGQKASFAVRVQKSGANVLVTRGSVQVSGLTRPLAAGQQLTPESKSPQRAPRPAHLLGWTRELMAAAEPELVPASKYEGGALVAIDPDGQETKLSLRKYHIDVHMEDGFARTTIDQTYFNHENSNLEGTFYFPLPADASLSRLAMYVDGNLMEGGMVVREYGAEVYETIRHMRKDPALLEWVDGSTFKMRVFPLEARKEKRILLSYTQKLPALYGQLSYRFPAGHSLPAVRDWSVNVRVKGGATMTWASPSHKMQSQQKAGDLLLTASAKDARFDRDMVLQVTDPALANDSAQKVRFATALHEGQRYLLVQRRPDLLRGTDPAAPAPTAARNWLFLFESSGDRDPLVARVQIEVIRHLLAHAGPQDTFNILTANTRVAALAKEPQPVTAANIEQAITMLEGAHLIGALDLGQAFTEAARVLGPEKNNCLVHVGSGIPAMGERRLDVLAKRIPQGTHYIGVGVGRRWSRGLMKAAAERSGGYFTQINPDEPVGWRSFELFSAIQDLGPDHLRRVEIEGLPAPGAGQEAPRFLYFNQLLTAGEELCAVTRLDEKAELPERVVLRFSDGKKLPVPVQEVKPGADYLPRTWARLEIERLLAENAAKHKDAIIALSKAMYVMTPYTSLLVLENEDMYTQYKVDRGRQDHWAMYPAPRKIQVVYEPDPSMPGAAKGARTAKEVLQSVVVSGRPRLVIRDEARKQIIDAFAVPSPLGRDWDLKRTSPGGPGLPGRFGIRDFDGDQPWLPPMPPGGNGPAAQRPMSLLTDGLEKARMADAPEIAFPPPARPRLERQLSELPSDLGLLVLDQKLSAARMDVLGRPADSTRSMVVSNGSRPLGAETLLRQLHNEEEEEAVVGSGRHSSFSKIIGHGEAAPTMLYRRPGYSGQAAIFANLLAYAPGMNTNRPDVLAVLEAEAIQRRRPRPGKIDPRARTLIDQARQAGWQKWTIAGAKGQPDVTLVFDGQGRLAYERVLSPGLREQVVCDGEALLHLYPQLGLGARRSVSRFHRADLAAQVPWLVLPAEDLARGTDLVLLKDNTVAVVPHITRKKDAKGKEPTTYQLHLVFGDNGQLVERQLVQMPGEKILSRQLCSAAGVVRLLDEKGKELAAVRGQLTPVEPPDLKPSTKNLVVVELPYRSPEYLVQKRKLEKVNNRDLRFADAIELLAAHAAAGSGAKAQEIFKEALHPRNQRQLGLYVLLASCGQNLDAQNGDVLEEHPDAPLAQYLALHSSPVLRGQASQWAVNSVQWQDPLLQHLAVTHALYQRWQGKHPKKWSPVRLQAERKRALDYVQQNKDNAFGWVMLCLLEDQAGKDRDLYSALAEEFQSFAQSPTLGYAARYERARCLQLADQRQEARAQFTKLYTETLKKGYLPAIDGDFRQALLGEGQLPDTWSELLGQSAADLIAKKQRPAVLALAWQCWQLEDGPMADRLLGLALDRISDRKEQVAMTVAGVQFYRKTAQLPQADQLLQTLLKDPEQAKRPELWRLASAIATDRSQSIPAIRSLERALDLEFQKLPEVIDLKQVRENYRQVLGYQDKLATAMVALKLEPPPGFLAKVVRTADRWRSLDPQGNEACDQVADILRSLGQQELAWDYLTTPIGLRPNEAQPWVKLAQNLRQIGNLELAEKAYQAATESEPIDAQILWDRAQNLRQAGRTAQAQRLLRQLAEGRWQPRFQGLVSQAKQQLQGS